ncbi:MAG: hypothetical protein SX243_20610 [Acidobacteriota bacterium]|nr:hypothetical protein [Acidobacteriota bacterium]
MRWALAGSVALLTGLLVGILAGTLDRATAQGAADAPQAAVIVELPEEPGILSVGLPFEVLVEITGSAEAGPRFPRWRQRWGDAEIVSVAAVEEQEIPGEEADGESTRQLATLYRQRLTLRVFRPGPAVLPPVAIFAGERPGDEPTLTPAATVEIAALLPPDAAGPLPPVPPKPLPGVSGLWLAGLLLVIVTTASLAYLYRQHFAAAGPGTPGEELLQALVNLRRRAPDPVAFHHDLSHALRRFLGRTLRFDGERASTRQVERVLSIAGIPTRRREPAANLLRQCDAVRFGGHPSTRQVMVGRLAAARKLANAWALPASLEEDRGAP